MPWLTTEGASHQVADGETVVGSGAQAGWRLVSQELAARHFIITRHADQVTIRPCGVDAVIAINGKQTGAHAVELRDGDTIDAGSARFLYSRERSRSSPPLAVSPAHLIESQTAIVHPLLTGSIGIGRDRLNAVVVRDPTASRFHAEIRREAGGYVLHPQGSSGTQVNGRGVGSPERLQDGDRIEIANVEFRFVNGAIPAGARVAEPAAEDESSHRPTVMQMSVMEIPSEQRTPSGLWIAIAVVVVALATIWLATR